MCKRPKHSAHHDRAERNDPHGRHLLHDKEVAIGMQAGTTVEEKKLLAERFVNNQEEEIERRGNNEERIEINLLVFFNKIWKRLKR